MTSTKKDWADVKIVSLIRYIYTSMRLGFQKFGKKIV